MFNIQLQHNNHNNHTQSTYHKQLNKHLHTRSNSLALNVNHYQTHMQTLSPKMGDQTLAKINFMTHRPTVENRVRYARHKPRSYSLLLGNKLTKSQFSLRQVTLNKISLKDSLQVDLIALKQAAKSLKCPKSTLTRAYRSQTSIHNNHHNQPTHHNHHNHSNHQSSNTFQRSKSRQSQDPTLTKPIIKFNLLSKPNSKQPKSSPKPYTTRTPSQQHKQSRLTDLKKHTKYLSSLLPPNQPQPIPSIKPSLSTIIIHPDKIIILLQNIIKIIEQFCTLHNDTKKIGNIIKRIDGGNVIIRNMFMSDQILAKAFLDCEQLQKYFQVCKPVNQRNENFVQEDLNLYNLLDKFLAQLETKYNEDIISFEHFEHKKISLVKSNLAASVKRYQQKYFKHKQLGKITKFLEMRNRFNQQNRNNLMVELENRGVKLSVVEKSRAQILETKQQAISKNQIQDFM